LSIVKREDALNEKESKRYPELVRKR
jgi:hypothetical protein